MRLLSEYRIGGISDLFITCMLWFIFDDKGQPTIFIHGDRSYFSTDVIKSHRLVSSVLNEDIEEEHDELNISIASSYSLIGDRMIAQFFNVVEGPDRDWSEDFDFEVQDEENIEQHR